MRAQGLYMKGQAPSSVDSGLGQKGMLRGLGHVLNLPVKWGRFHE